MDGLDRKQLALEFLRSARAGDRTVLDGMVTPNARHHNPYFGAGMPILLDAIVAAAKASPRGEMQVRRVLGDGDLVAVHSHVHQEPGDRGVAVVHLLRFEGERIAEFWDIAQPVPEQNPNSDGMF